MVLDFMYSNKKNKKQVPIFIRCIRSGVSKMPRTKADTFWPQSPHSSRADRIPFTWQYYWVCSLISPIKRLDGFNKWRDIQQKPSKNRSGVGFKL